ncbi:hypothetical protein FOL47_001852 [Perkinsus chesapeaki]|uniref:Uncharacterized protein n=1 Tax=Perkinsus chesapeaki TaxID=330153 RepID=A0A7J6KSS8_PERCH|nr:hypothetical protein FOL47_001852 [Perkinsus chesapeaki]
MGRPKVCIDDLLSKWSKDYPWLEWRARGIDGTEFRCKLCSGNPSACAWGRWRDASRVQKSIVVAHNTEKNHVESLKLHTSRTTNDSFWSKQNEKVDEARLVKLKSKRDLVKCALWLAREELAVAKFPSLLRMVNTLSQCQIDTTYHSSVYSCWQFLESADVQLLSRDVSVIKGSAFHSLILDSTSEDCEWLVILARCYDITSPHKVQVAFWDLIHVPNTQSQTVAESVLSLYRRDGVDVTTCCAWCSDGCSSMVRSSKVFAELAGISLIFLHCLAHRLDLCLSADVWRHSTLCKDVERALRASYCLFNRSPKRRSALLGLQSQFDRVLIPGPLIEIRWLSKLRCMEAFYGGREALSAYINQSSSDGTLSSDEEHILSVLERENDLSALLDVLRVLGKLSKQLQERDLDLFAASLKINTAVRDLKALDNLPGEVSKLRDDLCATLASRIPSNEFSWLGLLHLNVEFPKELVMAKIAALKAKIPHVTAGIDETTFYRDYAEIRGQYVDLVAAGADPKTINIAELSEAKSESWLLYFGLSRAVSPTSVEAERAFSTLTRLRTCFRRRLHCHLPALVRIAYRKGTDLDDHLLDSILLGWDGRVRRRNRSAGEIRGPYKRHRERQIEDQTEG